jgi:small-conductance mechanosensitive channel
MLIDFIKSDYGVRIVNTGLSVFAILACVTIAYWLFKKKFDSKRKRNQFRSRMTYLGVLLFILVLTRIWVAGFTHVFTMLSLFAAGLVVTNKESIMNFSGWLIINWRGVFSEGDYIQIQNFVGYIDSIRMFHFKLYESLNVEAGKPTGRIIKVPNSLIITTPFVLFTNDKHFTLKIIALPVKLNSNPILLLSKVDSLVSKLWSERYTNSKLFSKVHLRKKTGHASDIDSFDPSVELKLMPDKEDMVMINVYIYCSQADTTYFEQSLSKEIIRLKDAGVQK